MTNPCRYATSLALALAACSDASYSIVMQPVVGSAPFSCTQTYPGIGTTASTVAPQDFRMYVHGVALLRADGSAQALALDQDGTWQKDDIAFLDFEDGTGTCATDSPQTNFSIRGRAPHAEYTGVQLVLGLPGDEDHLAAATAPAPLDEPAMWWSWLGGYRYLKVDLSTTGNPLGYFFHLGATDCTGASMTTIDCKYPNLATIVLPAPVDTRTTVTMDLAALLAGSNLDLQPDGTTTFTPGCMSGPGDPQCVAPYAALGLSFEDAGTAPAQTVFSVR